MYLKISYVYNRKKKNKNVLYFHEFPTISLVYYLQNILLYIFHHEFFKYTMLSCMLY